MTPDWRYNTGARTVETTRREGVRQALLRVFAPHPECPPHDVSGWSRARLALTDDVPTMWPRCRRCGVVMPMVVA